MLRRVYTIMVVPHDGGGLKRLSVSLNFVVSLAAIFLFCFVSSAFLAHFFLGSLNQVDRSEQYRVNAERLTVENSRVHSSLYRTVVKVDEIFARLEELADVYEWPAAPGTPEMPVIGGGEISANLLTPDDETVRLERLDGDASMSPLDSDWRAMAQSTQDKAEFWARLLERQICDQTNHVRALPTVWPLHGRVTSGYQWRKDPLTGKRQFHRGIDIAAPRGTPVLASGDGLVVEARRRGGYGNCIVIDHGNGLRTLYAHLSRVHVKEGDVVFRADDIGEVGSTGRTNGPHLHFEILDGDNRINPLNQGFLSHPKTSTLRRGS